jgi:hypothetical protein
MENKLAAQSSRMVVVVGGVGCGGDGYMGNGE